MNNKSDHMKCKCKTNCNPTGDVWCNTIVYDIYKNDNLEYLPDVILKQMIKCIEDKVREK